MTTSLSINPSISPNSFYTTSYSSSTHKFTYFTPLSRNKRKPNRLFCSTSRSVRFLEGKITSAFSSKNNMSITEVREEEEAEGPPVLDESDGNSKPKRIVLFVEPSPFAYVSGYKNRFQNFIRYLRELGDEVMVVTTHEGVPQEFYGAKLIGSRSFPCPFYKTVPLSLALSPRIISEVANFKPDIIHASSPGIMVFGALIIAKLLSVPIVMSYHTHVPMFSLSRSNQLKHLKSASYFC